MQYRKWVRRLTLCPLNRQNGLKRIGNALLGHQHAPTVELEAMARCPSKSWGKSHVEIFKLNYLDGFALSVNSA